MSKDRLSKLQKWILVHCYLKTIKKQLPDSWKYCRGYNYVKSSIERRLLSDYDRARQCAKIDKDRLENYLCRSEILLNYFNLRLSYKEPFWSGYSDKFETSKEYKSALVVLSRSLKKLWGVKEGDGYIDCWNNGFVQWKGYSLTEKGIAKAEELLNVNTG